MSALPGCTVERCFQLIGEPFYTVDRRAPLGERVLATDNKRVCSRLSNSEVRMLYLFIWLKCLISLRRAEQLLPRLTPAFAYPELPGKLHRLGGEQPNWEGTNHLRR